MLSIKKEMGKRKNLSLYHNGRWSGQRDLWVVKTVSLHIYVPGKWFWGKYLSQWILDMPGNWRIIRKDSWDADGGGNDVDYKSKITHARRCPEHAIHAHLFTLHNILWPWFSTLMASETPAGLVKITGDLHCPLFWFNESGMKFQNNCFSNKFSSTEMPPFENHFPRGWVLMHDPFYRWGSIWQWSIQNQGCCQVPP